MKKRTNTDFFNLIFGDDFNIQEIRNYCRCAIGYTFAIEIYRHLNEASNDFNISINKSEADERLETLKNILNKNNTHFVFYYYYIDNDLLVVKILDYMPKYATNKWSGDR